MAGKTKIAYVVSTLGNSGPTRQLSYIIRALDSTRYDCLVITLSPEPEGSLASLFIGDHIKTFSLGLGRVNGAFFAKKRLAAILDDFRPDVLHTQGLRADRLAARIAPARWIATVRNYPFEDYPMKFGRLRGAIMARAHFDAIRRCPNVVACSHSIARKLAEHSLTVATIQNGVPARARSPQMDEGETTASFVVSGSLIERKNVGYILAASQSLAGAAMPIRVLGEGPERVRLQAMSRGSEISFVGLVSDVASYIHPGDILVSSSLSEGLPNAILEGFSLGCGALLSDIPAHREINAAAPQATKLFSLRDNGRQLAGLLGQVRKGLLKFESSEIAAAASIFSADRMSRQYQRFYEDNMKHG